MDNDALILLAVAICLAATCINNEQGIEQETTGQLQTTSHLQYDWRVCFQRATGLLNDDQGQNLLVTSLISNLEHFLATADSFELSSLYHAAVNFYYSVFNTEGTAPEEAHQQLNSESRVPHMAENQESRYFASGQLAPDCAGSRHAVNDTLSDAALPGEDFKMANKSTSVSGTTAVNDHLHPCSTHPTLEHDTNQDLSQLSKDDRPRRREKDDMPPNISQGILSRSLPSGPSSSLFQSSASCSVAVEEDSDEEDDSDSEDFEDDSDFEEFELDSYGDEIDEEDAKYHEKPEMADTDEDYDSDFEEFEPDSGGDKIYEDGVKSHEKLEKAALSDEDDAYDLHGGIVAHPRDEDPTLQAVVSDGFDRDLVNEVVDEHFWEHGLFYESAEDLANAVLYCELRAVSSVNNLPSAVVSNPQDEDPCIQDLVSQGYDWQLVVDVYIDYFQRYRMCPRSSQHLADLIALQGAVGGAVEDVSVHAVFRI